MSHVLKGLTRGIFVCCESIDDSLCGTCLSPAYFLGKFADIIQEG